MRVSTRRLFSTRLVIFVVASVLAQLSLVNGELARAVEDQATAEQYAQLAEEIEGHFLKEVLPFWFPRCLDQEYGGFRPHFRSDGSLGPLNDKTIVFQSRMT
ncbi:MAG TPA: hypothetical protein PKI05_03300, partial [Thermogutta sp.]|nr:hypothetical protein [Thermogutta sp.]